MATKSFMFDASFVQVPAAPIGGGRVDLHRERVSTSLATSTSVIPNAIKFGDENSNNAEAMEWFGGAINFESVTGSAALTLEEVKASLETLDFLPGGEA